MLLWNLLVSAIITWIVIRTGLLDRRGSRRVVLRRRVRADASGRQVLVGMVGWTYCGCAVDLPAGVPEQRIFVYDGSRQSNNFTANVSGIAGSARIAISDIAFKGASLEEVKAVTGHEIGHYVLGHVWRTVIVLSVLAVLFFFVADRAYP